MSTLTTPASGRGKQVDQPRAALDELMMLNPAIPQLCLVTGATGYLGGRLVPALLEAGYRVRCLVRNPDKLRDVPWIDRIEVAAGDVLNPATVGAACADVDVVYYLVHSLATRDFPSTDRRAALITAEAARSAGVRRLIYLGGLHPDVADGKLSDHLGSRAEVGEIFLRSGTPTAVLQAAVIIGSGSASFEILRYLTERLPIMVTPSWVRSRVQPIAVRDVLHYLVAAAKLPADVSRSFDIGGPDVMTYQEMMQRYASVAGLRRRWMFSVRSLTPRLSSHWINIVTPVPRAIGAPLIDSLVHDAVRRESDIDKWIPAPEKGLTDYSTSITLALNKITKGTVETRWSDASPGYAPSEPLPSDPDWSGGKAYSVVRERPTTASPQQLWTVIEGIGGERGWYSFALAWEARGWIDRITGGVGLRRGRRHPDVLRVGDALDWWRVEAREQDKVLRLRAEMKVPGLAWLELGVQAERADGATYYQRAIFLPRGLAGHLYWWAVTPFHGVVFDRMARNITRKAEQSEKIVS